MTFNFLFLPKPRKYAIVIFLLLTWPLHPWAQQAKQDEPTTMDVIQDTTRRIDLIDVVKSNFQLSPKTLKREPGKKLYFSLLPVSAPIPGGGKALITSTSAGFYLGNRRNTFLSNVSFLP